MIKWLAFVAVVAVAVAIYLQYSRPAPLIDHWYVEPADNWQWRACVNGGCGSPVSYNDALWWVRTEGGTKRGKLTAQAKSATTTGDNSPIIQGNGGSVTINGDAK